MVLFGLLYIIGAFQERKRVEAEREIDKQIGFYRVNASFVSEGKKRKTK